MSSSFTPPTSPPTQTPYLQTPAHLLPGRKWETYIRPSHKRILITLTALTALSLVFSLLFPYLSSGSRHPDTTYLNALGPTQLPFIFVHFCALLALFVLCLTQQSGQTIRCLYTSVFSFLSVIVFQILIFLWNAIHSLIAYEVPELRLLGGFYFHVLSCVLTILVIIAGIVFVFKKKKESNGSLTQEQEQVLEQIYELLYRLKYPSDSLQVTASSIPSTPESPEKSPSIEHPADTSAQDIAFLPDQTHAHQE